MQQRLLCFLLCFIALASSNKGPVGWDTYRHLDRLPELRSGVHQLQFSSFDRSGDNDDGFGGTWSCLNGSNNITSSECLLATHFGPGEITSIWFTRDNGIMSKTGRIRIELDGATVLNASLQDVVDGKLGAPFVYPLVGNGADTSGGSVIKVPMPFRKKMKVVTEQNPLFYHVTYKVFADAEGVATFDPAHKAYDVIDKLRFWGLADPKPRPSQVQTETLFRALESQDTAHVTLSGLSGTLIEEIRIEINKLSRSPRVSDDGRAFKGHSSFRVRVAPGNNGARILRRYDPLIGHQRALVYVDGVHVGQWSSGPKKDPGHWGSEVLYVPVSVTANKTSLEVRNQFVSSELDFNEFRYDVDSLLEGDWRRTDVVDIGVDHPGNEALHGYKIDQQSWGDRRTYRYQNPNRTATDEILDKTRIKLTFDGQRTVDAPLGEFFGSGLGLYETRTLMFATYVTTDEEVSSAEFVSWWPMPVAEGAKIELDNQSGHKVEVKLAVTYSNRSEVVNKLTSGQLGYFHASHKRALTETGNDWLFLESGGRGSYLGATHTMRGLTPSGNRRNYLEGDERVYVDGGRSPALYGTGTEDFYESGWYFRNGLTFDMPLTSNPAYKVDGDGCQYDCTGAIRLMIPDSVTWETNVRFGIEHGPEHNNEPGDYSHVAYFYKSERSVLTQTDHIDLADVQSRTDHNYTSRDSKLNLTSFFEGQKDTTKVERSVFETSEAVSFVAEIAVNNSGVRIFRVSDQAKGFQCVEVEVDGHVAGTWLQPLSNPHQRLLEDSFDIEATFTVNKTSLDIQLTPTNCESDTKLWTASEYRIYSVVFK